MKIEINQPEYLMIRVAVQAYIVCLKEIIKEEDQDSEFFKILKDNEDFIKKLNKWQQKWQ